ncbi:NADH dehydrogenase [ubiquinone] iron-sulfur protein 5 [Plasmodiophora brassicae]
MSSGLGAHGSTGRCFLFWNAYSKCLRSATVPHKDCILERDDYMECLYHRKLKIRYMALAEKEKEHKAKQEQQAAKGESAS